MAEQLINNLDNPTTSDGDTEVQLKVLATWYLKPFKGNMATRIGICNWPHHFHEAGVAERVDPHRCAGKLGSYYETTGYVLFLWP